MNTAATAPDRLVIHFTEFRAGMSTSTICKTRFTSALAIADRRNKSIVTCMNCLDRMTKKGLI